MRKSSKQQKLSLKYQFEVNTIFLMYCDYWYSLFEFSVSFPQFLACMLVCSSRPAFISVELINFPSFPLSFAGLIAIDWILCFVIT